MGIRQTTHWVPLNLAFPKSTRAYRAFIKYAYRLQRLARQGDDASRPILAARSEFIVTLSGIRATHRASLKAAAFVLTDLVAQRWRIRITKKGVFVLAPSNNGDRQALRASIRFQELLKRDDQLRQPSVQSFIRSMEQRRLHNEHFISIFSLMRDGRELAESLRKHRKSNGNGQSLSSVVDPYLQFVGSKARCEFTGLRLMDIWRYFRHTWTNQYTSVPGRSMLFLVRDAAAPNHAVMGIGAICSPVIQISARDKWIGWHPDTFIERVQTNPTARLARWLLRTVDKAIDEIYKDDFLKDGLLKRKDLTKPSISIIRTLTKEAEIQKRRHQRFARKNDFYNKLSTGRASKEYWVARARTPLFRSKRAQSLASLLELRSELNHRFGNRPTASKLAELARTGDGQRLIRKIVKKAKADRVGIAMADISVCGAVQPYNALLTGKLISMLAVSPAIISEYKRRYACAKSEIASSMAGRPIVRKPELVYFGTTSLYGNGSSQYNRVRIPCELLGGDASEIINYREIGQSESFGTSQFSDDTVEALAALVRQTSDGKRVNSIFGEGVSPRLRKVRAGLDQLGFPSDVLLQHGRRRSIYAIVLARNAPDYLIGLDRKPEYIVSLDQSDSTEAICSWWIDRWLRSRIQSNDILEQVASHTHVQPICHGARVSPVADQHDQAEPFRGVT